MVDVVLFILASPVLFIKVLRRAWKRYRFYTVAYSPRLTCGNCKEEISLLGLWRCSCGYTYSGHILRFCPICHTVPRIVRCFGCGTTRLLPTP